MESTGVMQQIRELLESGMASREIIESGYAPGSVYKAQRQSRRKAMMAQTKPSEPSASIQTQSTLPNQDALIDQLQHCQQENERLQSEVGRLRGIEQESRGLKSQIAATTDELDSANTEIIKLATGMALLTHKNEQQRQQLHEASTENADLKNFLASTNCQWQHDFAVFKQRNLTHGSVPSSPSGVESVALLSSCRS